MKKIKVVVVGNCQARPIAALLEKMNDQIEVVSVAIVHLLKTDQEGEYAKYFLAADYIIAQLVSAEYPCEFVRTENLQKKYGAKVTVIVNLFFKGYTPDWMYLRLPGSGPLKGPMMDYHNQTVVESWINGFTVSETINLMKDKEYNVAKYYNLIFESLDELKRREQDADVRITDFIEHNMYCERLFFTFNHPSIKLIIEYCCRVLSHLELEYNGGGLNEVGEVLNQYIPVLNDGLNFNFSQVETSKGVEVVSIDAGIVKTGKTYLYNLTELVEAFYWVYEENSDLLRKVYLSQ